MKCSNIQSSNAATAIAEACNALQQHFPKADDASLLLRMADLVGAMQRLQAPVVVRQLRMERDLLALRVVELECRLRGDDAGD